MLPCLSPLHTADCLERLLYLVAVWNPCGGWNQCSGGSWCGDGYHGWHGKSKMA